MPARLGELAEFELLGGGDFAEQVGAAVAEDDRGACLTVAGDSCVVRL